MQELVLRYLRDQRKTHDRIPGWCNGGSHTRTAKWWYPSQLGGCDRANLLQHIDEAKRPIEDGSLLKFWMGDVIDAEMKKIMRAKLDVIGTWQDLSIRDETYRISGRPDIVYRDAKGVLAVKEVKSIMPDAFDRPLPLTHHETQTKVYLTFAPTCPSCGEKLEVPQYADIVYVNKAPRPGQLQFSEYRLYSTPEVQEEVKSMLVRLEGMYQTYLRDGTFPAAIGPVPVIGKDGQPELYQRSGSTKSGRVYKAGEPKVEESWQATYCDFRGTGKCCADSEEPTDYVVGDGGADG